MGEFKATNIVPKMQTWYNAMENVLGHKNTERESREENAIRPSSVLRKIHDPTNMGRHDRARLFAKKNLRALRLFFTNKPGYIVSPSPPGFRNKQPFIVLRGLWNNGCSVLMKAESYCEKIIKFIQELRPIMFKSIAQSIKIEQRRIIVAV